MGGFNVCISFGAGHTMTFGPDATAEQALTAIWQSQHNELDADEPLSAAQAARLDAPSRVKQFAHAMVLFDEFGKSTSTLPDQQTPRTSSLRSLVQNSPIRRADGGQRIARLFAVVGRHCSFRDAGEQDGAWHVFGKNGRGEFFLGFQMDITDASTRRPALVVCGWFSPLANETPPAPAAWTDRNVDSVANVDFLCRFGPRDSIAHLFSRIETIGGPPTRAITEA